MIDRLDPTDTFHVEFNTEEMPGRVLATEITIRRKIAESKDVFRLDLCNHPLYEKLFRYCMDNPPPGFKINRQKV